jgi:CubicO group peptidase (beta-lactamase class C family)
MSGPYPSELKRFIVLLALGVVSGISGSSMAVQRHERFLWQTASPESEGLSRSKLNLLRVDLSAKGTRAFLVIKNDRVVCEWYAPDHGPGMRHNTASLAKALVGGMSLLVALNDGRIKLDEVACKYISSWQDDSQKKRITIRQLATHSSGIEDAEVPGKAHEELEGWKGAFWKRIPDPFSVALYQAPVVFAPGTRYAYSNPGMAALAFAVTASLKGTPEPDLYRLLKKRIMDPIGVPESDWSIGYDTAYAVHDLKLYANWGGASYTARAAAQVGRLMLRKGNWEGSQLLSSKWVESMVSYAGAPLPNRSGGDPYPASALCWWTNFDGVWSALPRDAFAGAGAGSQVLLAIPSLKLLVVRNGSFLEDSEKPGSFWAGIEKYLFNPLMNAVNDNGRTGNSDPTDCKVTSTNVTKLI